MDSVWVDLGQSFYRVWLHTTVYVYFALMLPPLHFRARAHVPATYGSCLPHESLDKTREVRKEGGVRARRRVRIVSVHAHHTAALSLRARCAHARWTSQHSFSFAFLAQVQLQCRSCLLRRSSLQQQQSGWLLLLPLQPSQPPRPTTKIPCVPVLFKSIHIHIRMCICICTYKC